VYTGAYFKQKRRVDPSAKEKEMELTIQNKSNTNVTITEGCITMKIPASIPPGGSGKIQVPYDSCTVGVTYDNHGLSQSLTRNSPVSRDTTVTLMRMEGDNNALCFI
jgi:hypothetical protein